MNVMFETKDYRKQQMNLQSHCKTRLFLREAMEKSWEKISYCRPFQNPAVDHPLQAFESLPFETALAEGSTFFQRQDLPEEMLEVNRETIKWCQAFFDEGEASFPMPSRQLGLYASWKKLAVWDSRLRGTGLQISDLSDSPEEAIEVCLRTLKILPMRYTNFLTFLLTILPGWAGYAKYCASRQADMPSPDFSVFLTDYLAVRVAITAVIWPEARALIWRMQEARDLKVFKDAVMLRISWNENKYRFPLMKKLQREVEQLTEPLTSAKAQLVFCADSRSEPFRRAVETAGDYETFGYGCFLEVPFMTQKVQSAGESQSQPMPVQEIEFCKRYCLNRHKSLTGSDLNCLSFSDKCAYAEGALRMMGLIKNFAPLVIFFGHKSVLQNTPYSTELECAFCGGAAGVEKGRALAAILNQPDIRQALASNSIYIPHSTQFTAAEHNTISNHVGFHFDPSLRPASYTKLVQLKEALQNVITENHRNEGWLFKRKIFRFGIRPQWGIGQSSSMIIAPRTLTREIDLAGRTFLQSYDWRQDYDGSLLEEILSGPMKTAHQINCQYLLSSFDNTAYGSGSKSLQNIIGRIGFMLGNGSDLMYGLPSELLYRTKKELYHEPQRLLVVIYAPRSLIGKVLSRKKKLKKTFANGWAVLTCIDPEKKKLFNLNRNLTWTENPLGQ